MPLKPRDQWIPNDKLREARERVYGRKSRTPFANAVKRRCEERFGGHCGVDHRKIRRWEEGACVPDLCHQEVICELVGVPWEERERLGFPVPAVVHSSSSELVPAGDMGLVVTRGLMGSESAPRVVAGFAPVNGQCWCAVCGGQNGAAGLAGNGASQQEGSTANRREFMRLVRAFACTPVPLDALERFAAYFERPRPVDEALVQDVERLTVAVGAAYDTTTPRRLLMPARLLMKRTTPLLAGSMLPTERQRLLRCASEGTLLVGWLRFNLDERIDARAYWLLTEELAAEAPDGIVLARALGALSTLHSTTYQGGNTAKALQLAEQANAVLPEHAPAGVRSYLAIREAVEHAASRDVYGYGQLTERAEVAGSQVQNESGMLGPWDEGRLNSHKGACLYLLNQPAEAEHVLRNGLKYSSLAKVQGRIASYLVGVYATQGQPEAACSMGIQALSCILEVGYVVGLRRLFAMREGFPKEWDDLSCVEELDEGLRVGMRKLLSL